MGLADNTLIRYIWCDNGSSMEGTETGTFNELTTITGIPLNAEQQLKLMDAFGGIDAWGGPVMQPHFACAWAWAGNTPFQWGKQVASHFGGTRNPMVVSWPNHIKDKGGLRSQFSHVIDVAPTITDRKSTRLNSSHLGISYAVFCLKKKKKIKLRQNRSRLEQSTTNPSTTS